MYYIECGRHLAWGYVDHGPIVAVQAKLAETLFGTSLTGLRLFAALAFELLFACKSQGAIGKHAVMSSQILKFHLQSKSTCDSPLQKSYNALSLILLALFTATTRTRG